MPDVLRFAVEPLLARFDVAVVRFPFAQVRFLRVVRELAEIVQMAVHLLHLGG